MTRSLTRREVLEAFGLGAAGLALHSCRTPAGLGGDGRARPNVLLITSEDNGPHIGCYGDPFARTPNLDRLAAQGARFETACVTYSVCSPSRASIFTGLYPHQSGQIGLATHKYAMFRAWPNAVSLLKKAGYRTGVIGKIHVNPESAFPFDFKPKYRGYASFGKRDVVKTAAVAEEFIRGGKGPFFLMVNFPDTHFPLIRRYKGLPKRTLGGGDVRTFPFVGVDNPRIREYTADYYNCMSRLDTGMGLLMDVLERTGAAENTLVLYLGDHGPQFSRGKCTLYEGGLRVALLARFPGRIPAGTVRKDPASSVDLLPTILEACGLEAPPGLPGVSLLRPEGTGKDRFLFAEKSGAAPFWTFPQRAGRRGRWKIILTLLHDRPDPVPGAYARCFNPFYKAGVRPEELAAASEVVRRAYETWERPPRIQLYDLEKDPWEFRNLAGDPAYADVEKGMLAALEERRRTTGDPFLDPEKLARYVKEMDRVVRDKVPYRKRKGFHWKYLDYLGGK